MVGCNGANLNDKKVTITDSTDLTTPVQPEYLIDYTKEKVSFSLEKENSLVDLNDWIVNDMPSNALLSCSKSDKSCKEASLILEKSSIPFKYLEDNKKSVTLVYNKITTRDCSYSNKKSGNYLLGCATSYNMIGMISDYRQFVNPNLLEARDAGFATQNYNNLNSLNLQNME